MGLVSMKCPSCGANLELDNSKDYGICDYCGTKVMQEKIVVEHRIDESGKYKNYINLANRAYLSRNYKEAYEYYTKALEIDQSDCMVNYRKAVSSWFLSSKEKRPAEVIGGVTAAYSSVSKENKAVISNEIYRLVSEIEITTPAEFIGSESCENYISQIESSAELLYGLYEIISFGQRDKVYDYCNKAIAICDSACQSYTYTRIADSKKTSIKLNLSLSGVSINGNTSKDETAVFTTPMPVLANINSIREFFAGEINKETLLKLKNNKLQISEDISKIKKLPAKLIILHAVFSIPMIIIGIIVSLFIHPVTGLILIAVEILCYFIYLKLDADKQANEAYGNLMQSISSYVKNKKQIKR